MPGYNAAQRNALQSGAGSFAAQVRRAMKDTSALLADVGGANSDEMKAAGAVLARAIRKTLSKRGAVIGGTQRVSRKAKEPRVPRRAPSAPGQPPAVQAGQLRRSVGQAVVDGVRRVGLSDFVAPLLESGVASTASAAITKGTTITTKSGKRRKSRGKKATRAHVIAPRPFMEVSLAAAQSQMTDAFVVTLQRRGGV